MLAVISANLGSIPLPKSDPIAIPLRPSTSQLAEDLLVDPEALKMETHEPGIYDEKGIYVPQFSDDPSDLEALVNPLDAPEPSGDTVPESAPADSSQPSGEPSEPAE